MSQHTSCRSIKCKQRQNICTFFFKNEAYNKNCKHTFQAVSQKGHCPCFLAKCAQRIRCARISASMLTDICFVQSSNNVRSLKQAKNIPYQNTDQTFQHFTQLFSPRSRIINFREVPRNPNASRTLFSIYLVYEKCISSLSFTKITNVGGLTPTCVI